MVNNTFYKVVNDLMARAATGAGLTPITVLDYGTFIDAGRQLTDNISAADITNAFAKDIANKVRYSLNIVRSYNADGETLNFGDIPPESVVEVINNEFMDTRAAEFPNLVNGQSVDMYVINKAKQVVDYYVKSEAFQIPVTIQTAELEGAFRSPEAMERFLYGKITYALNSKNHAIEVARYALLSYAIIEATESTSSHVATPATNEYSAARRYKLISLYNSIHETNLTADNAPYDRDFIAFAVSLIKSVRDRMKKASTSYNAAGVKTFTPEGSSRLKIIAPFRTAIESYLYPNTLHNESNRLDDYEVFPYWQNEDKPYEINYSYGATQDNSKVTPKVLAMLHDEYAAMEFTMIDDIGTTPYNVAGKYTNDWVSCQHMRYVNHNANLVIFTLD